MNASSSPQRREGWSIGRRGHHEGDSPEASSVLDESESPRSSRTPSESFLTQLDEEFKGQIKSASKSIERLYFLYFIVRLKT